MGFDRNGALERGRRGEINVAFAALVDSMKRQYVRDRAWLSLNTLHVLRRNG